MEERPAHPDIARELADILPSIRNQRCQNPKPVRARKSAQLDEKEVTGDPLPNSPHDWLGPSFQSNLPILSKFVCWSIAGEQSMSSRSRQSAAHWRSNRISFGCLAGEEGKQQNSDDCKYDNVLGTIVPVHSMGPGLRRLNGHRRPVDKA